VPRESRSSSSGPPLAQGDETGVGTTRYKKVKDYPADYALACDLIYVQGTAGHFDPKKAAWNLASADGHVLPRPRAAGARTTPDRRVSPLGAVRTAAG
jgi:hypothetical protein